MKRKNSSNDTPKKTKTTPLFSLRNPDVTQKDIERMEYESEIGKINESYEAIFKELLETKEKELHDVTKEKDVQKIEKDYEKDMNVFLQDREKDLHDAEEKYNAKIEETIQPKSDLSKLCEKEKEFISLTKKDPTQFMKKEDFSSYFVFRYIFMTEVLGIEYKFDTFIGDVNRAFEDKISFEEFEEKLIQSAINIIEENINSSKTYKRSIIEIRSEFDQPTKRKELILAYFNNKNQLDLLIGPSRFYAKEHLINLKLLYYNMRFFPSPYNIKDLCLLHLNTSDFPFYKRAAYKSFFYDKRVLTGGKRKSRNKKHLFSSFRSCFFSPSPRKKKRKTRKNNL